MKQAGLRVLGDWVRAFCTGATIGLAAVTGCGGGDDGQSGWPSEDSTQTSPDGGSSPAPGQVAGGEGGAGAQQDGGARSTPDASAPFVEGPHPPAPQIVRGAGSVLASPKFVAVTFDGDSIRPDLESFLATIGSTPYWSQVTSEYGVGPAVALAPVHVSDTPPTTIDDNTADSVATWLSGKLDGTHPEFGTPDSSTVYVIVYPPQTTTVTCYHSNIDLPSGPVPYAVSSGCGGTGQRLYPVSHEIIEAATDPFPGQPAYGAVDEADYAYAASTGAYEAEIGDLCQVLDTKSTVVGNTYVTTAWSNRAAMMGQDPCVPNQMNRTYFATFPVLPDVVAVPDNFGTTHMANGLRIPMGQSKTIELDLFSSGPAGDWTVSALDVAAANMQPAALTFAFDKTTGHNGDKIHLTVSSVGAGTLLGGVAMFILESSLGDASADPSRMTLVPIVVVNE